MLLIHPPVAKPGEPPAGIAHLAGELRAHGLPCRVLDANLEGLLWLLEQPSPATDTWTRRASRSRADHLAALRGMDAYRSPDRYRRAVSDLNRLLAAAGRDSGAVPGLADYRQDGFSPYRAPICSGPRKSLSAIPSIPGSVNACPSCWTASAWRACPSTT